MNFSRIYLSNNQSFAAAAIQEGTTEEFEENWNELTKILNATLGPKKTAEEWKLVRKYFYVKNHNQIIPKNPKLPIYINKQTLKIAPGFLELEDSAESKSQEVHVDGRERKSISGPTENDRHREKSSQAVEGRLSR